MFRLRLTLGHDYPAAPPKGALSCRGLARRISRVTPLSHAGIFLTRIFHPNVSASGDICVNTLKRDWTPETTLSHVLAVVRCLLIVPFPESSLNDDAGKLFMESYDEYARKARLWTSIHAMPQGSSGAPAPAATAAAAAPAAGGDATAPAAAVSAEGAPAAATTEASAAAVSSSSTGPAEGGPTAAATAPAPAAAAAAPQAFRTTKGNGAPPALGGGASSGPAGSKRPAAEGSGAPVADRARKEAAAAKRRL